MRWQDDAACRGMDIRLFYPVEHPGHGWSDAQDAALVCARCPVRAQCLEAGMTELWGIWGGLSPLERRALSRALAG